jgi:hypothetical protein
MIWKEVRYHFFEGISDMIHITPRGCMRNPYERRE